MKIQEKYKHKKVKKFGKFHKFKNEIYKEYAFC